MKRRISRKKPIIYWSAFAAILPSVPLLPLAQAVNMKEAMSRNPPHVVRRGAVQRMQWNTYIQLHAARVIPAATSQSQSAAEIFTERCRCNTVRRNVLAAPHAAPAIRSAEINGWMRNAPAMSPEASAASARVPPHVRHGRPVTRRNWHTRIPSRCSVATTRPIRRTAPRSASHRRTSSRQALRHSMRMSPPLPATRRCVCRTARCPRCNVRSRSGRERACRPG